jgi:predicted nuclease of predicted toxin-antitoxin system
VKLKFQADEDLNERIVRGLRRRESAVDFQSASVGRLQGQPDPEVLALAAADNRVLVSHDRKSMLRHFARFIASQTSPGLIIVPQYLEIGIAIEQLLTIWSFYEAEELINQHMFLPS